MNILTHLLTCTQPTKTHGILGCRAKWQYLDEGVISFTPEQYTHAVVISAGVHGNETAPIEILSKLCQALFDGTLRLAVRLLVIFGNPVAIRAGVRYIDDDMNRLFLGNRQSSDGIESCRAHALKQLVQAFFDTAGVFNRLHYDLHTAIRTSLMPTFALLPNQTMAMPAYDDYLLASLSACKLNAIVYHTTDSTTFTSFTLNVCQAHSATLELGKALPFGQNTLTHFIPTYDTLQAIISNTALPTRQALPAQFIIQDIITKDSQNFALILDKNTPNFTKIQAGKPIATDGNKTYCVDYDAYTLFLNADVKVGLRAGMLMRQLETPHQ